jgi:hypothetical protein
LTSAQKRLYILTPAQDGMHQPAGFAGGWSEAFFFTLRLHAAGRITKQQPYLIRGGSMKKTGCVMKLGAVLLAVLLYAGCTGESGFVDFQFNLNQPQIKGREVTINGGVVMPVERIQWEWGDGQMEKHHFFPFSHTYKNPGTYEIRITVFDSKNQSATRTVTVDIK